MQVDAFQPTIAGSQTLSVTGTSGQSAVLAAGSCVEVTNAGTVAVFMEQAPTTNTPTAVVATGYPVLAGQCKVVRILAGVTKLAFIGASAGPTTVYISSGEGV